MFLIQVEVATNSGIPDNTLFFRVIDSDSLTGLNGHTKFPLKYKSYLPYP